MRGSAVAEALAACEAGEWEGIRQLREWNGGRLRITLERMLGDEAVAAQALETALDDIWRHAGAHRAMGVEAEDWLFGRLRQVAQSYRNGSQTPAHLRPVPNVAGQAATDALSPTPSPPEASHLTEPDPGSPDLVNSRIRRPSAPVQSHPVARRVEATAEYRGGRGWLRAFLLWLLAGTVGLGLAAVGLLWLTERFAIFPGRELRLLGSAACGDHSATRHERGGRREADAVGPGAYRAAARGSRAVGGRDVRGVSRRFPATSRAAGGASACACSRRLGADRDPSG